MTDPNDRADEKTEMRLISTFSAPASGVAPIVGASAAVAVGLATKPDGSPTIPITNVLDVIIEGYLLGDLESMATEIEPKEIGAVGYPMFMAVLSGSELLGALAGGSGDRIENYWTSFMARVDPRYGYLGEIASRLARNGIAHSFLSHYGVLVLRGRPGRHLSLWGGEIVFDCIKLYEDFRYSYERHARAAILDDPAVAQRRVDALLEHDLVCARTLIGRLPPELFPETLDSETPTGLQLATPVHARASDTTARASAPRI
jgi:hypothetical protein